MDRVQPKALRLPLMRLPVGLWVASFVLDVMSLRFGNGAVQAAFYCVAAGSAVAILITAATMLDYNRVPTESPIRRTTVLHAIVFTTTILVFSLDAWLRTAWLDAHWTPFPAVAVSALGLTLVAIGGFLARQVGFDSKGNVVHLVRPEDEAPPGTIPFRPRRR